MTFPQSAVRLGKLLYRAWVRRDESAQFDLLDKTAKRIYPRYKMSEFGRMYLYDEKFIEEYERTFDADNYHSLDRKYMLDQLLKLVREVPGNTAECGAYKGASSYFICRRTAGQGRLHRVFDSFAGLSSVDPVDGTYWKSGALAASEHLVRRNLADFPFVTYHKGWIPECFGGCEDETYAFVHIDVDLYRPTLDSLQFFYDKMESGGVLLCDDSGFALTCPGARKAMDEFFCDKPEPVIEVPTGQSFIIKQPARLEGHDGGKKATGRPIASGVPEWRGSAT
jgi:O-methyltransferase